MLCRISSIYFQGKNVSKRGRENETTIDSCHTYINVQPKRSIVYIKAIYRQQIVGFRGIKMVYKI